MALSGSISKTIQSRWRLRLSWSATQDIANNRSTVTAILYWESLDSYGTIYADASFPSAIQYNDGAWHIKNATAALSGKQTKEINRITFTINHNADGTASFSLDGYFDIKSTLSGTYYDRIDLDQKTFTLNTIPRASSVSVSPSSVNMGSAVTINISRASSSFTHTLKYSFAGTSGTIATGVATSYSWTPPLSLANRIPNATSGSCTITCETYSGSTKIGTKSTSLTLNVPSSVVPTFTTITHSEYVSNVATKIGSYVQNLSRLNLAITGASGTYGSTIKSYEITFDGNRYTTQSATSSVINGSGTLTITGKITDSRGRTATKSVTVTVLAYQPPKITTLTIRRADSDGSPNDLGTYASVTRAGSWHSLGGKNSATVVIKSKARGTTTWTTKHTTSATTTGTFSGTITVGTYTVETSHDFRVEVTDQFYTTIADIVLPTGLVTMSWSKDGIGVGKVHERGSIDALGDIYSGGINLSSGNALPSTGDGENITFWHNLKQGTYFVRPSELLGQPTNWGIMDVKKHGTYEFTVMWYSQPSGKIYRKSGNSSTVTGWVEVFDPSFTQNVLWSGAIYLQEGQSAPLSKNITDCKNGIILAWSDYDAGVGPNNFNWLFDVVPKHHASTHAATGVYFTLVNTDNSFISKYVYIHNDKLVGYAGNNADDKQKDVVLRYVLEF